jgi:tetratricopeptide (TPR) repeat protein
MPVGRSRFANVTDTSSLLHDSKLTAAPMSLPSYESPSKRQSKRSRPCDPGKLPFLLGRSTTPAMPPRQPVVMIKAEPVPEGQSASNLAVHQLRLRCLTVENLEEAAKALRGTSRASGNCVTLARGMLDYLHTGIMPSLVGELPNTVEDFATRFSLAYPIKLESSRDTWNQTSSFISRSSVVAGGLHDADIPAAILHSIEHGQSNEILDSTGLDLTQYSQPSMSVSESAATLEALARYHACAMDGSASPAIYGLINVVKCNSETGHQLVYFARPGNVMFIDSQKIYEGRGSAVSSNLETLLPFNDNPAILGFQTTIFVTPIHPASSDSALKNKSYLAMIEAVSPSESTASEGTNRHRFDEDERLDRIVKIIRKGLPCAALDLSKNLLSTDVDSATLHAGVGLALSNLRRYHEAMDEFDKAITLNENEPMAHRGRSLTLIALKRFDEALASLDRLIQLKPNEVPAHKAAGRISFNMGRSTKAIAAFDRAIALCPGDFDAHRGRGLALGALNLHNDALTAFDRALEVNSQDSKAHWNRSIALSRLGRGDECLVAIDMTLRLEPHNATVYCARAIVLNGLGRLGEAMTAFNQSLLLNPNDHVTHAELGQVLYNAGLHADALSAYNRSICIGAHNPRSYKGSGNALIALQRYAEALIRFRWAILQAPDDFSAYKGLALTLTHLYRFDEALAAVEKAISLQPDDVSLHDLHTAVQFAQ